MLYSSQNESFRRDKIQFFSQLAFCDDLSTQISLSKRLARSIDYSFILQHQRVLEVEFSDLFHLLQNSGKAYNIRFWLYCYYCATLLENYHQVYDQKEAAAEYGKIKKQIKMQMRHKTISKIDKSKSDAFFQYVYQSFLKSVRTVLHLPSHISQIKDSVAYANLCRLYWVFYRSAMVQGLTIKSVTQWIEKLDMLIGKHTDIDKLIASLHAPTRIINYLSVGLFLVHFLIEGGLLIKHTFFPSSLPGAIPDKATRLERFKYELYKRHCSFANDLVWATVNFLANFNQLTHIPGPIAGYLTAAFLVFDVGMIIYKCQLAKKEYLVKRSQYLLERAYYNDRIVCQSLSAEHRMAHIDLLNQQLNELERNWHTKEATFYFNALAASMLMMGFTLSMLVSGPLLVACAYLVCTLAAAMYLSCDAYSNYQNKTLRLEEARLEENNVALSNKEYLKARDEFIFTLGKNTMAPLILLPSFLLYWPAAVFLTVLYLGYELGHAYNKREEKEVQQSASPEGLICA